MGRDFPNGNEACRTYDSYIIYIYILSLGFQTPKCQEAWLDPQKTYHPNHRENLKEVFAWKTRVLLGPQPGCECCSLTTRMTH